MQQNHYQPQRVKKSRKSLWLLAAIPVLIAVAVFFAFGNGAFIFLIRRPTGNGNQAHLSDGHGFVYHGQRKRVLTCRKMEAEFL